MNENLKKSFKNELKAAFKQSKNIQEIIETHWIENRRVKKNLKTSKEGKCDARQKLEIYVVNK